MQEFLAGLAAGLGVALVAWRFHAVVVVPWRGFADDDCRVRDERSALLGMLCPPVPEPEAPGLVFAATGRLDPHVPFAALELDGPFEPGEAMTLVVAAALARAAQPPPTPVLGTNLGVRAHAWMKKISDTVPGTGLECSASTQETPMSTHDSHDDPPGPGPWPQPGQEFDITVAVGYGGDSVVVVEAPPEFRFFAVGGDGDRYFDGDLAGYPAGVHVVRVVYGFEAAVGPDTEPDYWFEVVGPPPAPPGTPAWKTFSLAAAEVDQLCRIAADPAAPEGVRNAPPPPRSFVDLCLAGEARPDDIDDFIGRWHAGAGAGQPLHEFLGLSAAEYEAWAALRLDDTAVVERALFRLANRPDPCRTAPQRTAPHPPYRTDQVI